MLTFAVSAFPSHRRPSLLRCPSHRPKFLSASRTFPRAQCPYRAPDYTSFAPENDTDYQEVRVLSLGRCRNDGSLLTLRPVAGTDHAFKMSVTTTQADSIRAALKPPAPCTEDLVRPATHDLFKKVLDIAGVFATKAAITHIQDEVFIARLWIRLPDSDEEMHVDARPSDAIAMAVRSNAPLFLNSLLLRQWNVPVEAVERDAKHGLCETLTYSDRVKSTRSIREELRGKPEHIRLAKLKMELDLAVRLERFAEACDLKEQISRICPIEQLQEQLKVAVTEERFLDASRIQDQIIVWKARLRMWEKGSLDLDNFVEGEEQP